MDQLLSIGIKLICAKVVDLIDLVHNKRLDIDSCQDETKCSHQEWIDKLDAIYKDLLQSEHSKIARSFELLVLTTQTKFKQAKNSDEQRRSFDRLY
jgi:hypothetical protein